MDSNHHFLYYSRLIIISFPNILLWHLFLTLSKLDFFSKITFSTKFLRFPPWPPPLVDAILKYYLKNSAWTSFSTPEPLGFDYVKHHWLWEILRSCSQNLAIWVSGRMLVTTKQIWRSWLKEEQNLVKTFELSDEIRTEGDHGSYGYWKKDMFTHRFREIHAFRTLRPSVDHLDVQETLKRITLKRYSVNRQGARHFPFFRYIFECGPHLVDSRWVLLSNNKPWNKLFGFIIWCIFSDVLDSLMWRSTENKNQLLLY